MRGIGWRLRKLRLAGPGAVRKKARIFELTPESWTV